MKNTFSLLVLVSSVILIHGMAQANPPRGNLDSYSQELAAAADHEASVASDSRTLSHRIVERSRNGFGAVTSITVVTRMSDGRFCKLYMTDEYPAQGNEFTRHGPAHSFGTRCDEIGDRFPGSAADLYAHGVRRPSLSW